MVSRKNIFTPNEGQMPIFFSCYGILARPQAGCQPSLGLWVTDSGWQIAPAYGRACGSTHDI